MPTPRRGQLAICHAAAFDEQADFNTPLNQAVIDTRFNLNDTEPRLEFILDKDEIYDCTGQYLLEKVLRARKCRLTFGIEIEAAELHALIGLNWGVVAGAEVTMLSPRDFQLPITSLIYGHDGGNQDPLILSSMVLGKITLSASVNGRWQAELEWIGNGAPTVATAYTFPDCEELTPVRLKDGAFEINSVDKLADLRSIEFTYDNRLLANEDPFTMASPDITRMERDDRREYSLKFKMFGEENDTYETASRSDPTQHWPFMFRIGAASDGVQIDVADAIFEQDGGITHEGEARRAVLGVVMTPTRVTGNADTPLIATLLP